MIDALDRFGDIGPLTNIPDPNFLS